VEFEIGRWSLVVGQNAAMGMRASFGFAQGRLSPVQAMKDMVASQSTVANSLTGQFRYVVLVVWVLVCGVLGWVGFTDQDLLARIFFGVFLVLASGLLLFFIREESALASNHMFVSGEVLSYSRRSGRRGGPKVHYRFVALDGRRYEVSSNLFSTQRFRTGPQISILYNPLMPQKSKPLAGFIFYRFDGPEASS
jgi:type IV secretory pathway VirB2 component (pilin)